jgi:DNA-binding MarR family transcriptional regulator
MNQRENTIKASLERFFRIVNKINSRDRIPMDFGTGETLFMGEIHTIEAVGNNLGASVTGIAKALGVTKGAVSQMITRLATRDYVTRLNKEGEGNEMSLGLTPKGRKAYTGHEKYHMKMYAEVFKNSRDDELESLEKILTATEYQLNRSREEIERKKPAR